MKRALFLDRDGVINVDRGYVHRPEQFELVDGIIPVMRFFQALEFSLVIVTNQAGIARGYYGVDDFHAFDAWVRERLSFEGVEVARTFFSPYHPDGVVPQFARESSCRKPAPGMFLRAIEELGLVPGMSWVIGDKATDVMAADAAGVGTLVLVGDEPGRGVIPQTCWRVPTVRWWAERLESGEGPRP